MYYRRYYEWVLSFHNQGSKHQDISKRITIVQSIANRKKTARTAEQTQNGDKWGNQYVVDEYHRYDKQFENIKIYNIHNIRNGDVREPIICEVLSNRNQSNVTTSNNASGSHSCNRLRTIQRAEEDISKANSHEPLIYSELAYFALQMSLWKERGDLTINDVTALIADRQERILNMTEHDFTTGVTCISEESYDWLLQSSLEAEEILFPEFYRIQGKDEVIEGFNKSKRSFCHVDARAVLSDETDSNSIGWRDFFKSL